MSKATPYRPSNGTEGSIFMDQWCFNCAFNDWDGDGCDIQLSALAFGIGAPEYPAQWVYRDDNPVCTAFHHQDAPDDAAATYRCELTPDMFAEPS